MTFGNWMTGETAQIWGLWRPGAPQVYGIGHLGEDLREGVIQLVDLCLQLTAPM
jgi:hypothetical protein